MKKQLALLILAAGVPLLAADNGKLNDAERAFLVDQLEQSKKAMLASIQGVSGAQWHFKPAPEVWSVQECAEHIILSEDYLFQAAQQMLKSPAVERPAKSNAQVDQQIATRVEDRSQKGKAPEPLVPAQRFASASDAASEFVKRRDRSIAYVKSTQDDLRVHVGSSPAGQIDVYQFLVLMAAHSARHTAQIREVEGNAGYPKTVAANGGTYLVVYQLAHGTLDQLTAAQMAKLREHAAYVKQQVDKGVITWAGRTTNPKSPHGYAEVQVPSEADARAYANNDPAVQAGVFEYTVEAFSEVARGMKM